LLQNSTIFSEMGFGETGFGEMGHNHLVVLLSPFTLRLSELAERNSTKTPHTLGSEWDLKHMSEI